LVCLKWNTPVSTPCLERQAAAQGMILLYLHFMC